MTAVGAWAQTTRTLGDIPEGWTVLVNGNPVTVTNGIPSGWNRVNVDN